MESQLYVIVDVPISFKDKEHDELAYDIERYRGIINNEKWHAGPDPAFDWISTRVIIPAEWVDNLPQGGYEKNGFILSPYSGCQTEDWLFGRQLLMQTMSIP